MGAFELSGNVSRPYAEELHPIRTVIFGPRVPIPAYAAWAVPPLDISRQRRNHPKMVRFDPDSEPDFQIPLAIRCGISSKPHRIANGFTASLQEGRLAIFFLRQANTLMKTRATFFVASTPLTHAANLLNPILNPVPGQSSAQWSGNITISHHIWPRFSAIGLLLPFSDWRVAGIAEPSF